VLEVLSYLAMKTDIFSDRDRYANDAEEERKQGRPGEFRL
jgi:hypothetical protein